MLTDDKQRIEMILVTFRIYDRSTQGDFKTLLEKAEINRGFLRDFPDDGMAMDFAHVLNCLAQHRWDSAAKHLNRIRRMTKKLKETK